jgi:hypothetical protein
MSFLVAILIGLMAVPVSAQGPSSYESTVAITNVSNTAGTITLQFYDPDGSDAGTQSETIDPLETLYFQTFPVASGFQGSMVISSSVPLASSSTIIGSDTAIMNYASYVGVSTGASSVYIPLLMDDNYGYNTYFSVQNTGTADVDVTIAYSDGLSASITDLAPGAAKIINNQSEAHTTKKFSATLTADGPIAVAVVEWADGSYGEELFAYNGFPSNQGTQNPVIPMVNQNNYGFWTSIPIQNLGTVDTTVTLTYYPTKEGAQCSETLLVPAGSSAEFGAYAFVFPEQTPGSDCAFGETFVGNAVVTGNTAGQPLIGLTNQGTTILEGYEKAGALMTINPAFATSKVTFPETYQWFGADKWWSSITIINVSGSTLPIDDVTCRGIGQAEGSPVDISWSNDTAIADQEGWIIDMYWDWGPMPEGFMGGITCESTSGEILGTLLSLGHIASNTLDTYTLYEGINVAP